MAKQCTHCGQELSKDDAQFCSRCGMLVAPAPEPEKGRLEKPLFSTPPVREKPGLREQIAQQPMSKPPSLSPEHPAWIDVSGRDRSSPSSLSGYTSLPSSLKKQSGDERGEQAVRKVRSQPQRPIESPAQQISPLPDPSPAEGKLSVRPAEPIPLPITPLPSHPPGVPPARELRIKVWEQDGSETQYQPELSPPVSGQEGLAESTSSPDVAGQGELVVDIEDLPTGALPASSQPPPSKVAPQKVPSSRSESGIFDIEDLPTNSIPLTPAQRDVLGDRSAGIPPMKNIDEIARVDTVIMPANSVSRPVSLPGLSASVAPVSLSGLQGSAVPTSLPVHQPPVAPPALRKPRRRPLLITLLALCIFLLVAGGIWTFAFRPFSVAPVTQPWQEYQNTDMKIALHYPTGWSTSVPAKGTVSLHDSSNTAMLTLSSADSTGSDAPHMLQQQVSKLNVTNAKALDPLSFAGAQWQREQGSVQLNGATYTITLLVAAHGKSFYTLEQFAAQNVSNDYEQLIFSPMRASIRFL